MINYTHKGLKIQISIVEQPVEGTVKKDKNQVKHIRWVRSSEIEATLLGRDISTIAMASFVKAQLQSYLHKRLGEIRTVNSGFGSKDEGFLHFDLSEKTGVKYLKVRMTQGGDDCEIEYYNYAQVVQMSVVIDKLIQNISADCKVSF